MTDSCSSCVNVEMLPSEFHYFTPQQICDVIEQEYDVAVNPRSALDGKQPLEFYIPAEEYVFRDLNNSILQVTCKITNADGSNLAATAAVAPVNNFMHSLFRSCDVLINGRRVNEPSDNYAERAYLEKLLSEDASVLTTRGICEGWHKDDASRMDTVLLTAAGGKEVNSGFVARSKWCAASKTMVFAGRLHSDLFHQPLDIPCNVPIEIKLEQNPDKKVLMAAADSTFAVKLLSVRLFVRSKKLNKKVILAQKMMLQETNFMIPYTRVTIKKSVLSKGSTSLELNEFFSGPMPNRITLCFVTSTGIAGAYAENPFNYANFDLSELQLKVGSNNVPHEPMKMNFGKQNYVMAYLNTLASLQIDQGDKAISITPLEWADGYNVYVFKLVPGYAAAGMLHPSNISPVSISVAGSFSTELAANVTVLAYIESPALLEIDSLNNVVN